MKTLAEFTKTTLIGGVLIVLPIYVSLLLLAKAAKGLLGLMKPITEGIPASFEFREILAVLLLAAVCFVAGLIARTGPGLRAKNAFDKAVLERLPGYTLLRGLAARFTGQADGPTFAPGPGGNRRGTGTGTDHRGTGERVLYGAGAVGANANGRIDLHSAARACASGRCAAYHSAKGVLEVGYWRWGVCMRNAAKNDLASRGAAYLTSRVSAQFCENI
jgi:hypothetical protein